MDGLGLCSINQYVLKIAYTSVNASQDTLSVTSCVISQQWHLVSQVNLWQVCCVQPEVKKAFALEYLKAVALCIHTWIHTSKCHSLQVFFSKKTFLYYLYIITQSNILCQSRCLIDWLLKWDCSLEQFSILHLLWHPWNTLAPLNIISIGHPNSLRSTFHSGLRQKFCNNFCFFKTSWVYSKPGKNNNTHWLPSK